MSSILGKWKKRGILFWWCKRGAKDASIGATQLLKANAIKLCRLFFEKSLCKLCRYMCFLHSLPNRGESLKFYLRNNYFSFFIHMLYMYLNEKELVWEVMDMLITRRLVIISWSVHISNKWKIIFLKLNRKNWMWYILKKPFKLTLSTQLSQNMQEHCPSTEVERFIWSVHAK